MISDSIIVMAAGASTRMKNSNFQNKSIDYQQTIDSNKSKSLIGFGKESKPFISFLISNISNSGFKHVYIVVPKNSEYFKNLTGYKSDPWPLLVKSMEEFNLLNQ